MNSLGSVRMLSACLLCFVVTGGCRSATRQGTGKIQGPPRVSVEERLVEELWKINENTVLEAALWLERPAEMPVPSSLDFSAAIEFFERTTGIESHTGSPYGRVPNESVYATVAEWNAWFEENKHTLVLTPSSCIGKAPFAGDAEKPQEMEHQ